MSEYDVLIKKLENSRDKISEEEAKAYLGKDIVFKIFSLLNFRKQNGWTLLLHGTSVDGAQSIMTRGYKLGHSEEINQEEFLKNVGASSLESLPENGIKYEIRTGDITDCISIEYAGNKSGGLNEDLAQHFTGYRGFSDLVGRCIAHNFGVPCTAMVFVLYPNFIKDSDIATDYYGYNHNDYFDDDFYIVQRMPREIVLGYLDVKKKELVINPHFSFDALSKENMSFQATDTSGLHFTDYILDEQQQMTNVSYKRK